jgi:hypothetical protein
MENFRVRFTFDNENTKILTVQGHSKEDVLLALTNNKGWYIDGQEGHAINMELVKRISFVSKANVSGFNM